MSVILCLIALVYVGNISSVFLLYKQFVVFVLLTLLVGLF